MREFVDGELLEKTFPTSAGWMAVTGDVTIREDTVHLSNFDFQPLQQPKLLIGVRGNLAIRRALLDMAKAEGYTDIVFEGDRITGRNPGRSVHYERSTR